jgi:hypothetical protein
MYLLNIFKCFLITYNFSKMHRKYKIMSLIDQIKK